MPKLRDLRRVDERYATTGPNHALITQTVNAPAEALFNCLADGPAWKDWLGIEVEWTSDPPFGVGTTRTVTTNGQRIDEYFLAWDTNARICFCFDRSTLPVAAFAEDYLITSTGDGRCELNWHYAYEWDGPLAAITSRLFAIGFALNGRRALKRLAKLVETSEHF